MQISCSNQRVVVTAGAAGIGRAIAESFAAAGASVFVCDADARALAGMAGRMVTVQDVANMAVFLASAAGASISGQELSVCGNVETMA